MVFLPAPLLISCSKGKYSKFGDEASKLSAWPCPLIGFASVSRSQSPSVHTLQHIINIKPQTCAISDRQRHGVSAKPLPLDVPGNTYDMTQAIKCSNCKQLQR